MKLELSQNTSIAIKEMETKLAERQETIVRDVVERIKKTEDVHKEFSELYSLITNNARALENLRRLYEPLFDVIYLDYDLEHVLSSTESKIVI